MMKALYKNEKYSAIGHKVLLGLVFAAIVALFVYWMTMLVLAVQSYDWLRAILSAIFAGIMLNKIIRQLIEWSQTTGRKMECSE